MNYAEIKKSDIANGTGVRVSLFVSGCRHYCKNCFNKEAWDFDYGKPFTDQVIEEILNYCRFDYIDGISILGGEPFEKENHEGLLRLLTKFRNEFPEKNVWCYTGFVFEDLVSRGQDNKILNELISNIDVLVDGKFEEGLKSLALVFRGSSNQRIIDVNKSLDAGQCVLLDGVWERNF